MVGRARQALRGRRLPRPGRRQLLLAGCLTLLVVGLSALTPTPAQALELDPPPSVEEILKAIIDQLFKVKAAGLDGSFLQWLIAVPDFVGDPTTGQVDGGLGDLVNATTAIAFGLLSAVITWAVIHYWLAGMSFFRANGTELFEGITRSVGAALLIICWPLIFTNGVALTNSISAALVDEDALNRLADMLSSALGSEELFQDGTGMIVGIVITIATIVLVLGLAVAKIGMSTGLAVGFGFMPIALVLFPVPWLSFILQGLIRFVISVLAAQVLWAACLATYLAVGEKVLEWGEQGSVFGGAVAKPFVALAMLSTMMLLTRTVLRLNVGGSGGGGGGAGGGGMAHLVAPVAGIAAGGGHSAGGPAGTGVDGGTGVPSEGQRSFGEEPASGGSPTSSSPDSASGPPPGGNTGPTTITSSFGGEGSASEGSSASAPPAGTTAAPGSGANEGAKATAPGTSGATDGSTSGARGGQPQGEEQPGRSADGGTAARGPDEQPATGSGDENTSASVPGQAADPATQPGDSAGGDGSTDKGAGEGSTDTSTANASEPASQPGGTGSGDTAASGGDGTASGGQGTSSGSDESSSGGAPTAGEPASQSSGGDGGGNGNGGAPGGGDAAEQSQTAPGSGSSGGGGGEQTSGSNGGGGEASEQTSSTSGSNGGGGEASEQTSSSSGTSGGGESSGPPAGGAPDGAGGGGDAGGDSSGGEPDTMSYDWVQGEFTSVSGGNGGGGEPTGDPPDPTPADAEDIANVPYTTIFDAPSDDGGS